MGPPPLSPSGYLKDKASLSVIDELGLQPTAYSLARSMEKLREMVISSILGFSGQFVEVSLIHWKELK